MQRRKEVGLLSLLISDFQNVSTSGCYNHLFDKQFMSFVYIPGEVSYTVLGVSLYLVVKDG